MQVSVRPMTGADVEPAREVQTRAFQDYDRAHGEPVTEPNDAAMARQRGRFEHFITHDPDGSWVATVDDVVVGAALALRRDGLWGLSLLVVDPERQSNGAGRALLQASLRYAQGASLGIILSSRDPRAIRSYGVAGFDLFPQINASGVPDRSRLRAPELRVRDARDGDVALADAVDRDVRGAVRGPDHEAMRSTGQMYVVDDAAGRGYSYIRNDGRLVTIAATSEEAATSLLWDFLGRDVGAGEERAVDHLTGEQQWAVRVALEARLTLQPAGPVFWRGRTPPPAYVPDGAYL